MFFIFSFSLSLDFTKKKKFHKYRVVMTGKRFIGWVFSPLARAVTEDLIGLLCFQAIKLSLNFDQ